jgi:hypothetical protein
MAEEEKRLPDPIDLEKGYEVEDLSVRGIVTFGIGLVIVILLVSAAMFGLYYLFAAWNQAGSEPLPPLLEEATSVPPAPRIQRSPAEDNEQLKAYDESLLNSYGWVDEGNGVVRIPIEQAMELTLERGLPTRPQNNGDDQ